uniref:Uncharacterized protein n=1 Tax=Meloidogyne enterolobii TaxID=390850 RepID=A0A6V7XKZ0_MELEN|nr:unnamed protein product [Meloidogyne enterolobii]
MFARMLIKMMLVVMKNLLVKKILKIINVSIQEKKLRINVLIVIRSQFFVFYVQKGH